MLYGVLCFAGGFALGVWVCVKFNKNKPVFDPEDGAPVCLSEQMIDALNKDEPKRPHIGYKDNSSNLKVWYCPRCFYELCREDDAGKVLYCPECGQRIDWSDAYQW